MAKRGRAISLDRLVSELGALDRQRAALMTRIKSAVSSVVGGWTGEAGASRTGGGGRPPTLTKNITHTRRKMSAAARKKISIAQKNRWAKVKLATKK